MSVLVGKPAPGFKTQAMMQEGNFKEISLSDYKGKNVLLFFYPLDFTFVWQPEPPPHRCRSPERRRTDGRSARNRNWSDSVYARRVRSPSGS